MAFSFRIIVLNALMAALSVGAVACFDLHQHKILAFGVALAGLVAAALVNWYLTKDTAKGLDAMASALDQAAKGNLSIRLSVDTDQEISRMAKSFNQTMDFWNETMRKFFTVTDLVRDSVALVGSTTDAMSQAAEDVALQASTIATASEEMSATSGDIARNCVYAAESAQKATMETTQGAEIVQSSSRLMENIAERVMATSGTVAGLGDRSDQIGAIAGTIEDIADQTNLLALNAAIEAARAGETGRGFAVVADEVRALAERTTKATKEIDAMIRSIQTETRAAVGSMSEGVEQVQKGTAETSRSGEVLEGILNMINDLSMQISQIATAAEEQTATTHEITQNIQLITTVVSANVSSSRETKAATAKLAEQVDELHNLVGHFQLTDAMVWDDSFATTIGSIDAQHKNLFKMVNELSLAMQQKRSKEVIGSVLQRLIEYTGSHFAHEEEAFKRTGYPGTAEHLKIHGSLVQQVLDLQRKFQGGETVLTHDVIQFLQNWLVNHIKGDDKRYAPHLKKHGIA